ncbi:hypothetical protein D3C71_1481210 [compost metagenome]
MRNQPLDEIAHFLTIAITFAAHAVIVLQSRHGKGERLYQSAFIEIAGGHNLIAECHAVPIASSLQNHAEIIEVNIRVTRLPKSGLGQPAAPLRAIVFMKQTIMSQVGHASNGLGAAQ